MIVKGMLPLWLIRDHSSGAGEYSRGKVDDGVTHEEHDTLRVLPPVLGQLPVIFRCLFIIQGEQDVGSIVKAALCL
jgi:hypothetical protein